MMFIAIKTKDGVIKGKLSFYCRMLGVSRQGFYKYLAIKDRPWKYQDLADAMRVIHAEDECNDTYGRIRMYQALLLKNPTGIKIPSERTVYRVMDEIGLVIGQSASQMALPRLICEVPLCTPTEEDNIPVKPTVRRFLNMALYKA